MGTIDASHIVRGCLAVDPGEETGLLMAYLLNDGQLMWKAGSVTGSPAQQVLDINGVLSHMIQVHEICIERFELSARTLKGGQAADTTDEVYRGLKVFLEMGEIMQDEGVVLPTYLYRPSDIQISIPDEYMKLREYWIPGNKQHRDAMRLFLYHARVHRNNWGDVAR